MQCVILAAGRGTRMGSLTEALPKPLLMVGGKILLEHQLDILPDTIDEVILVVGYLGSQIERRFGGFYNNKKILYVEQGDIHGTAGALWSAREILRDKFLVMMADDIHDARDVERCLKAKQWALLVQKLPEMNDAGDVQLDKTGRIIDIVEGRHGKKAGLASTNLFFLDTRIFQSTLEAKELDSQEFGLPQTALSASKQRGIKFEAILTEKWIRISEPADLQKAEKILLRP